MTERETRSFRSYDGTRLAYHLVGSGPLLLCLPGGPGRASSYLRDLGGLAARHSLVQLDSRGTGLSAFPDDPATLAADRLPDDVEALRRELDVEALPVLGHSAGAVVAMLYAARHRDAVTALVLVTPSGRLHGASYSDVSDIHAGRAGEEWYTTAVEARDLLAGDPVEGRRELERLARPLYYGRWDDDVAEHAHAVEREMSPRAVRGFAAVTEDVAALRARVRAITAPTLVVAGALDGITGVRSAREVAEGIAHARLVTLDGAGHFPWVDQPSAFAEQVGGFLDGLTH